MPVEKDQLLAAISMARDARECAYAPYSGFKVGAVVVGESGRVYAGCNVENASYGLTICAERVAIYKAIYEGEATITAVVIVAGDTEPAPPCGACLQVISEFSSEDDPAIIVTYALDGSYRTYKLCDLLPVPFSL